jgi:ATP-dependent protease ClpP protease subunit
MVNRVEELQSKGCHITTEIYGYGMSAGALLFLAGDTRIVHTGAGLMFHAAAVGSGYGGRNTQRTDGLEPDKVIALRMLDHTFEQMLLEKTTMGIDDVEKWLFEYDMNYMSAQEAFDTNVATVILGT